MKIASSPIRFLAAAHPRRPRCYHPSDAARAQSDAGSDQRVEVGLHRNGITLDRRRRHQSASTSIVRRQFSMFFNVAVSLDQGRFAGRLHPTRRRRDRCSPRTNSRRGGRTTGWKPAQSIQFGRARRHHHRRGTHELLYADSSCEPNSFPTRSAMRRIFLTWGASF